MARQVPVQRSPRVCRHYQPSNFYGYHWFVSCLFYLSRKKSAHVHHVSLKTCTLTNLYALLGASLDCILKTERVCMFVTDQPVHSSIESFHQETLHGST